MPTDLASQQKWFQFESLNLAGMPLVRCLSPEGLYGTFDYSTGIFLSPQSLAGFACFKLTNTGCSFQTHVLQRARRGEERCFLLFSV